MKKLYEKHGTPLISIGIPTYNRPENLRRTLMEITKQTYQNLEIIVSDNASPGNDTENVVRAFMMDDKRIQYFKQQVNMGSTFNFQFVLDQALGEYFIWVGDDDWHEPEFVESILEAMMHDETFAVAFCDFDIRNENGLLEVGYPNSYKALRSMTGGCSLKRQLSFFLLAEGRAIPHAIYGLLPMKLMKGFSWTEHIRRYGEYGADTLFVFLLLCQGRLALVERNLFACTVNNQKYHTAQKTTLFHRLRITLKKIGYLMAFIKIANGWSRFALLCVFPWKLLEMLYSTVVREPFQGALRMFGRWLVRCSMTLTNRK